MLEQLLLGEKIVLLLRRLDRLDVLSGRLDSLVSDEIESVFVRTESPLAVEDQLR